MPYHRQLPNLPDYAEALIIDSKNENLPHSYTDGLTNTSLTLTYTFSTIPPHSETKGFSCDLLNLEDQALAKLAMAKWSAIANIKFIESAAEPKLFIYNCDASSSPRLSTSSAFTIRPGITYPNYMTNLATNFKNGRFTSFKREVTEHIVLNKGHTWDLYLQGPAFTYSALLHELGHGLGLSHPFENGLSSKIIEKQPFSTYFSVLNFKTNLRVIKPGIFADEQIIRESAVAISPSYYDIKAAQFLYGTAQVGMGDDIYRLKENLACAESLQNYNVFGMQQNTFETLWDTQGDNSLSCVDLQVPVIINLNQGVSYRSYLGEHHSFALAGKFKNIIGGEGQHELILNPSDNIVDLRLPHKPSTIITTFTSAAGDDTILGFVPNQDTLCLEVTADFNLGSLNLESLNAGSTKLANATIAYNHGTLVSFANKGSILLANVERQALASNNIKIKVTNPNHLLQRQVILPNEGISYNEVLALAVPAFTYSALTTVTLDVSNHIMQNKLHYSTTAVYLVGETINLLALSYKGPFPVALALLGVRTACEYANFSPATKSLISLSANMIYSICSAPFELKTQDIIISACSSYAGSIAGNLFSFFAKRGIDKLCKTPDPAPQPEGKRKLKYG